MVEADTGSSFLGRWPVVATGLMLVGVCFTAARADEPKAATSPLIRLLESGRVPPERQPLILEQIGRRGTAADLEYLLRKSVDPAAFTPEVRHKALDVLADAARARRLRPDGDLSSIGKLLESDDATSRLAATRLAGLWMVEPLSGALRSRAMDPAASDAIRTASLDALVNLGSEAALGTITALAAADQPVPTRARAVSAWAALDLPTAARHVAEILREAPAGFDPTPLLAAFLNRKGGADGLAAVLAEGGLTPDAARLALRGMYGLGRSDAALVDTLSRAAGLDAEVQPLDAEAMTHLIAEVNEHGSAARGEQVFRRKDLNCMGCHTVAGAGGNVGPDLSPVGTTSPVDYLAHSIMLPDQSIKEQYQTIVVATTDGEVFQGIVADRDDSRVVLKEATGELRTVAASEIEEQKTGGSLMPKGLVNLMTHTEFVDLLRFLFELGKPGAYAIRPPSSIQRWQVLRDVPESLQADRPESIQVHTLLLSAEPDRWASASSLVSGRLPLAELQTIAGGPVLYLMGEFEVGSPGPMTVTIDSPDGVALWLNSRPVTLDGPRGAIAPGPGPQRLIVRIDLRQRGDSSLRVDLEKPPGSEARFTLAGGK